MSGPPPSPERLLAAAQHLCTRRWRSTSAIWGLTVALEGIGEPSDIRAGWSAMRCAVRQGPASGPSEVEIRVHPDRFVAASDVAARTLVGDMPGVATLVGADPRSGLVVVVPVPGVGGSDDVANTVAALTTGRYCEWLAQITAALGAEATEQMAAPAPGAALRPPPGAADVAAVFSDWSWAG